MQSLIGCEKEINMQKSVNLPKREIPYSAVLMRTLLTRQALLANQRLYNLQDCGQFSLYLLILRLDSLLLLQGRLQV